MKIRFIKSFCLLFLNLTFILSCAQQDEKKFSDRADIEARAQTKAAQDAARAQKKTEQDVLQETLKEKSKEMETDLSSRHYFYAAIEGQYQGTTQVGAQTYLVKFTFARSIPHYLETRVRQLSEIETDLNNLFFNIQVVQWHPDDLLSAVGCTVTQIRPDMQTGLITIASPDCPNLYTVLLSDLLSDLEPTSTSNNKIEKAKGLAEKVRKRELQFVDLLIGTIQPKSNAHVFNFSVKRLN